jgi:signal transduction histidine kinase
MAISDLERSPLYEGTPAAPARQPRYTGTPWGEDVDESARETPDSAFERIRRRLMRLAFDIHDGPLQSLAAAGFGLNDLQERIAALALSSPEAVDAGRILSDIVTELTETERSLRTLVTTLEDARPEIPFARDILTAELERFRRRSKAQVDVEGGWLFHPETRSQALLLEALLRESLTNIAKHADANRVAIRLDMSTTHVLLEIEDDGNGFDPAAVTSTIGLTSMRARVRLLGGDFEILSKDGGPTLVTAVIRRWRLPPPLAESYTAPAISEHRSNTTA